MASISVSLPKDPAPCRAATVASTEASRAQDMPPASWNRSTDQIRSGYTRKSTLTELYVISGTRTHTTTASPSASAQRTDGGGRRARYIRSSSGVTRTTPMASPTHQASQTSPRWPVGISSDHSSMPTPMPELTSVAVSAPRKTSASPSRSRLRLTRNPTARSSRWARTGAAVLPTTIPSAAAPGLPSRRTVSSTPSAMPGTHQGPNSSRAATATPLAGQMGVATAPSALSCCDSPSLPAA